MDAESLRRRLTELLGFAVPAASELLVDTQTQRDGYVEQAVSFTGDDGDVPALLLVPENPRGAGVVVHHQHHSQWQLGKSEVAGLCGDPWQAFGPVLARHGVTVIAHDAVGFEDRRPGSPGTDARESDASDYFNTTCYRLARGRPLMWTVLADAAAAHSLLAGLDGVDETRRGARALDGPWAAARTAPAEERRDADFRQTPCVEQERHARGDGDTRETTTYRRVG
jgi:hypothetical protein